MTQPTISTRPDNNILTYRRIRRAIGFIGIGLPIALLVLPWVPAFHTHIQPSISHYYYTNLREIFTGALCAVGLFLIRYQGHQNKNFWKNDHLLTNIAGYFAFGIALFPTHPDACPLKIYSLLTSCSEVLGWVHYVFAGLFFIILAIISINVFTIGQEKNTDIPVSVVNENHIYKVCGILILVFIALVPVCAYFKVHSSSTLALEAFALFAFGISWLIKGRVLGDKGVVGEKIYREHNGES